MMKAAVGDLKGTRGKICLKIMKCNLNLIHLTSLKIIKCEDEPTPEIWWKRKDTKTTLHLLHVLSNWCSVVFTGPWHPIQPVWTNFFWRTFDLVSGVKCFCTTAHVHTHTWKHAPLLLDCEWRKQYKSGNQRNTVMEWVSQKTKHVYWKYMHIITSVCNNVWL